MGDPHMVHTRNMDEKMPHSVAYLSTSEVLHSFITFCKWPFSMVPMPTTPQRHFDKIKENGALSSPTTLLRDIFLAIRKLWLLYASILSYIFFYPQEHMYKKWNSWPSGSPSFLVRWWFTLPCWGFEHGKQGSYDKNQRTLLKHITLLSNYVMVSFQRKRRIRLKKLR